MYTCVRPPGTQHWDCNMVCLVCETMITQGVCTGLVIQEPREDQIYQDTAIFAWIREFRLPSQQIPYRLMCHFQSCKVPNFETSLSTAPYVFLHLCVVKDRTSTQYIIDARAAVRHFWAKCKDKFGDRTHAESQSDSAETCMLQFTYKIWFDIKTETQPVPLAFPGRWCPIKPHW